MIPAFCALLAVKVAGPAAAQDAETLADIRQELQFVLGEIVKLKRELSTTGNVELPAGTNAPALQRIDALEAEIQRLTGQIEQVQFRIEAVVSDGTNRIGDLEFRMCELEANCDIASLGDTPTLGGGELPATPPATTGGQTVHIHQCASVLLHGIQDGLLQGTVQGMIGSPLQAKRLETRPGQGLDDFHYITNIGAYRKILELETCCWWVTQHVQEGS